MELSEEGGKEREGVKGVMDRERACVYERERVGEKERE